MYPRGPPFQRRHPPSFMERHPGMSPMNMPMHPAHQRPCHHIEHMQHEQAVRDAQMMEDMDMRRRLRNQAMLEARGLLPAGLDLTNPNDFLVAIESLAQHGDPDALAMADDIAESGKVALAYHMGISVDMIGDLDIGGGGGGGYGFEGEGVAEERHYH
ncbi:hypothetical protein GLAREA_04563 [Glarea lozoyensis ATCC 20868]|uniref:Uncharacterized protein n=1 Tax=Glarea lozoyensis (strain ATCC 20868 / MF5171) TaxID=1116229 RepID=S3CMT8_GLAL2|nr:uncharacterized protein GLAREA_04563 [Glarea lozoyensis ATCC 20868]EPE27772.1 hypothetical protein GLAREA_04563 [Glarea lozoyensis ATCC 20868]